MNPEKSDKEALTANPVAVSGTKSAHPVGIAVGAAAGAVTGAVLGSAIGPLGSVVGGIIGATAGLIAGDGIAYGTELTADEEDYWEQHYVEEPYFDQLYNYDDYGPAYDLGVRHYRAGIPFEAEEKGMSEDWERVKGVSKLEWPQARPAAHASWRRIHRMQSH
ncbi:MAG: hypothetical protein ABI162_09135 [Luteolibacter sp.]